MVKTVVLDDDPTGTQSASGVRVLLWWDEPRLTEELRRTDAVYVQTNSRALDRESAVRLATGVRDAALAAAEELGESVQFVLRGDSTLRGHVFAETDVFVDDDAVILFVPAFPDGGRVTREGTQYVTVDGALVPAHETEYAADPVFGFSTGFLPEYVTKYSGRRARRVGTDLVRSDLTRLVTAFRAAEPGSVLLPDVLSNDDISRISAALVMARDAGMKFVVRCGAPLAAHMAGVASQALLARPIVPSSARRTLLVCGSHTSGASAQLDLVARRWGPAAVLDTDLALADPRGAADLVAADVQAQLAARGFAAVTSERIRRVEHNTLEHAERVMSGLVEVVRAALSTVDVVVTKGGITSAEIARTGVGATAADVLGQVAPGVSVWRFNDRDGRTLRQVVVPGNVGGPDTLTDVLSACGLPS